MQKLTITTAAIIIAGSIVGASGVALASTTTATKPTTTKTTRHEKHGRLEVRLNQALRDGTITTAQKTAFQTELKTLRAERTADLGATPSQTAKTAERSKLATELQTWATSNNFPLAKIAPHFAQN